MTSNRKQIKLQIGGMTCVQCQNRIEKELRGTPGVVKASVSYTGGTADITYDAEKLSPRDLRRVIEKLDYRVVTQDSGGNSRHVIVTLCVIAALFFLLQHFGILNYLAPGQLADSSMGYGMLFVIGLITSVHCIAMCGGINLSQSLPRSPEAGAGKALLPSLLYNLGRVISYTAVGFLLGAAGFLIGGGNAGVSPFLQGILKLIAGCLMVIMGINMLGLFPRLRCLTPRMPKFLTKKLGTKRAKAAGPLAVGLLNGLMPCGPLQSMQIVALASGNPFAGALAMFLFSLGTVPLMLGLGSLVCLLGKRFTHAVNYVGAILVVVLGLAMLSQGTSLSGLLSTNTLLLWILTLFALGIAACIPMPKKGFRFAAAVLCAAAVILSLHGPSGTNLTEIISEEGGSPDVQVVTSTLSSNRYPNITVQAGTPVKWIIDAPAGSINGCNYRMLLQAFGITHTFADGENIIEFTPSETGTFQYSCWMGMIQGSITVISGDGVLQEDACETEPAPVSNETAPYSQRSCCS